MPEDGGACPPESFKCDQSLLPLITRRHVPLGVSVPLLSLPYLVESIAHEETFVRIFFDSLLRLFSNSPFFSSTTLN